MSKPKSKLSPDERRKEIIDTARRLFAENGVKSTAVSDIVKAMGVAQGTFYWYFPSKDEVIKAVAQDMLSNYIDVSREIINRSDLSTPEKFTEMEKMFLEQIEYAPGIVDFFHNPDNLELHNQLSEQAVELMSPYIQKFIAQGIEEGFFEIPYPEEAVVLLLYSNHAVHHFYFQIKDVAEQKDELICHYQGITYFTLKGLGCTDQDFLNRYL